MSAIDSKPVELQVNAQPARQDRILVTENIYHQPHNGDPIVGIDARYYRMLSTCEQVYLRQSKATTDWARLDCGWLTKKSSLLYIQNREGPYRHDPIESVRDPDVERRVLQISYDCDPDRAWIVSPGETFKGVPAHAGNLWLRSGFGEVRYVVYLMPA